MISKGTGIFNPCTGCKKQFHNQPKGAKYQNQAGAQQEETNTMQYNKYINLDKGKGGEKERGKNK